MRIVKYSPQERVDIPDITAMSYLMLGEFRRELRGGVLGENASYLINGFKVEPAAVPDTTILVKLDNGGGDLSFAFGAEAIGGRTDYGQIVGGDNSDGNTEGNAQQSLDFTGQPALTYTVQMRFSYIDGVQDNRAFWNETGNTEFIAATQTRTLPQFEIRFSGAASPEWIDLADVVWDGVGPINAGDITDLRAFVLEGTSPFEQTTRLGVGGIADFSRSTDRATNGLNALYPVVRGLARQIQDMKGADDSGNWNWWNDPYLPLDPSSTLSRERTTSLRSLRTVHFTVGDGVTTFGDFNGYTLGTGLDACLSHIETEQGDIEGHVIIQVLVNPQGGSDTPFQISNYAFTTDIVVEIRGGSGENTSSNNVMWWGTPILCAGTLTTPAFDFNAFPRGGLVLRQVRFLNTGSDTQVIRVQQNYTHLLIDHCHFQTDGTQTDPTIQLGALDALHVRVEHTIFDNGYVENGSQTAAQIQHWEHCEFDSTPLYINRGRSQYYVNCKFTALETAGSGQELVLLEQGEEIHFSHCEFSKGLTGALDANMIHMPSVGFDPASDIHIDHCRFELSTSSGGHAPGTGSNGAEGTGWAIYYDGNTHAVGERIGLFVTNCLFKGDLVTDCGAIKLLEADSAVISGNEFYDWGCQTGFVAPFCNIIHLDSIPVDFQSRVRIVGNTFRDWQNGLATESKVAIRLENVEGWVIGNNQFEAHLTQTTNAAILGFGAGRGVINGNFFYFYQDAYAVRLDTALFTSITGNVFRECTFAIWLDGAATNAGNAVVANTMWGDGGTVGTAGLINVDNSHNTVSNNTAHGFATPYRMIDLSANDNVMIGNAANVGDIDANGTTGHRGYNEAQDVNHINAYT